MTYFNPNPRSFAGPRISDQMRAIDGVYAAFGLPVPDRNATTMRDLLAAVPNLEDTYRELLAQAPRRKNDTEFLEHAAAELARVDAIRDAANRLQQIHRTGEGENVAGARQAVTEAIAPDFAATVKALTDAVSKLDRDEPLSTDRAFEQDATKAYKAACQSLTRLATFSALRWGTLSENGASPRSLAANALAGIVDVPQPGWTGSDGSKLSRPNPGSRAEPQNGVALAVLDAYVSDPDAAIIAIARSDFAGVSPALSNSASRFESAMRGVPDGSMLQRVG
ncbi:hypothetical protein [Microbacterium sp.]|uniref:hypothetical protein n=1 Tax=Microbacterium sp. TaxID=51671 RepID=UPI002812762E|nr:hypothetical protein [Microbacterium sp.]